MNSIDIISDSPYRELYHDVPMGWGGKPGTPIPRPQPSDFVNYYFKNVKTGFFIDVGANDGVIWSNTLGLETREEFWTGICIEPHPDMFKELTKHKFVLLPYPTIRSSLEELQKAVTGLQMDTLGAVFTMLDGYAIYEYFGRANSECIQVAISDKEGEADFLAFGGCWESNMLSGLVDKIDSKRQKEADFIKHRDTAKVKKVQCKKLQTILDERDITLVNYLSIDVEGSEISVLNSIDFNKVHFDLISVEANYSRKAIDKILKKSGYKFIEEVNTDCFYKKS